MEAIDCGLSLFLWRNRPFKVRDLVPFFSNVLQVCELAIIDDP